MTLIELLVVIALIAVSVGIVGMSVSNSGKNNLRECANSANAMISRVRINSMYRPQPVWIEIRTDGSHIIAEYIENGVIIDTKNLGRTNITVSYAVGGIPNSVEVTSVNSLRISFTRRGALIMVDAEGNKIDGSLTQIRFSLGDSLTYVIDITPSTGSRRVGVG